MPNPINWNDELGKRRVNREVRERSNSSSISPKDFVRLQAERTKGADEAERTKRAYGIEKSMAKQKEAQDQIDKQLVNRENKDINSPESPFVRTKEYEDMRVQILQAAEGRMKESAVPDSLNVEQGLSRKRQIELSQQAINEQRIRDSMQKPAVDTKPESDTSTPVSDNPHASIYQREIEQIQELIDTGKPVYAYFNRGEGSAYITDNVEKAQARFGDDVANLRPGDQLNGIQRIELEHAKMGIQDKEYGLKPELDITAPQVEKSQDRKADAIEAKEAEGRTIEMVRGSAFTKLGSEIRSQQVWSESADSWKNPRMDFKVMKENEPLAFKNLKDGTVIITWDNNYSRPDETPVPLNYAEGIINENGIGGVKWDLPTVYALKSEPKNLGDKLEVIVTDHKETADALKEKWGYRSLGELKIRDQDTKTNNDQRLTSVKDFVGADYADKLPVWMQKDDIRIGDFIEYQRNRSLTPQEFMQLVQGQPLEHESINTSSKASDHREQFEQEIAESRERLSRVDTTFAESNEGKQFNERKKDFDSIYAEISTRNVGKEVRKKIEDEKNRVDLNQLQMNDMYTVKEANPSLSQQYEEFYRRTFKDMEESIEFMEKALALQNDGQDLSSHSEREIKEEDTPARPVADILRTGRLNLMQRIDFTGSGRSRISFSNDYNKLVSEVNATEHELREMGISQEKINKQVEGSIRAYEWRMRVANEVGGVSEHGMEAANVAERIKDTLAQFEEKEGFVSSVENILGKKSDNDKTRQFSEKVYGDLKAKGVDETRMRLGIGIIKENKEGITAWLEDGQKTESDINRASNWLMNQMDQLLPHRNDLSTNESFTDARRQFGREMGIRGTGETRA